MTLVRCIVACLAFAAGVAAHGAGPLPRLVPFDHADRFEGFAAFRDALRGAIERRDRAFVLAHAAPDIHSSFGGDTGREAFLRHWNGLSADSPFWRELQAVLALGGGQAGDARRVLFCAPYYAVAWPDDVDAFDHTLVLGRAVNVRAAPSADAGIVGQVSYQVLATAPENVAGAAFREVVFRGRKAYVSSAYVRSALGYRACFRRIGGAWRMTDFVAGD